MASEIQSRADEIRDRASKCETVLGEANEKPLEQFPLAIFDDDA